MSGSTCLTVRCLPLPFIVLQVVENAEFAWLAAFTEDVTPEATKENPKPKPEAAATKLTGVNYEVAMLLLLQAQAAVLSANARLQALAKKFDEAQGSPQVSSNDNKNAYSLLLAAAGIFKYLEKFVEEMPLSLRSKLPGNLDESVLRGRALQCLTHAEELELEASFGKESVQTSTRRTLCCSIMQNWQKAWEA